MTLPNYSNSSETNPKIVLSFKNWLISKNYSSSTTRNYIADINRYLSFLKTAHLSREAVSTLVETEGFRPEIVSAYISTIKNDPNQNRYLSSLSKFFQFALDQKIISVNPLKKAQKPNSPTPKNILTDYQNFLIKKHFSTVTIKNYLNDIQQFIDWNQNKSETI